MTGNRHDIWQAFCETHRELITRTGFPAAVARTGQRFRDLLSEGQTVAPEGGVSLAALTPPQWSALYQFAAVFFREFESFAPADRFPAFRDEAQRRGDTFPR